MSEAEIAQAIAEQEEYIKRWKSCSGVLGRPHRYETFRHENSPTPESSEFVWRACINCGVAETKEDYRRKSSVNTWLGISATELGTRDENDGGS